MHRLTTNRGGRLTFGFGQACPQPFDVACRNISQGHFLCDNPMLTGGLASSFTILQFVGYSQPKNPKKRQHKTYSSLPRRSGCLLLSMVGWSEKRRFDIAGSISSVLRAHLQAYDPMLSMTLRYLISVHKGFCLRQGLLSPISDLTERLLLEERDPAATPQESLYEVPPFDEVDIQALAHAVELTRQGAVDSLRFAKGDLFQAFQNELCRMRLDVSVLDELVREYCVYRGIVDSAPGMQIMSGSLKVNQPEQGCCSSINCSLEVECTTSNSDGEISMSNAHMDGSPEISADVLSMQGMDAEERHPCETRNNHEDCSTSGTHQLASSKVLQRNRNQGLGERSKRKRWRGRQEEFDLIPEVLTGISKQELSTTAVASTIMLKEQKVSQSHFPMDVISNREDKFEIVLAMKELASRGMAAEVVEEVNAMDPNFFLQNPLLLFKLKQVEFLKLVSSGDHSTALRVARSHLGPLAASDPALLKPLKETLLALLRPNEDALGAGLPLNAIATSLQVAIGRRLGIEEPQIMKIMRATLYTHNGWFKLQMCKDPFEGLLRIGSLKDVSSPLLTDAATKSNADTCTHGSSQVTISSSSRMQEDGSSPTQVSSAEVICDENAILKVMNETCSVQYNCQWGCKKLQDAAGSSKRLQKALGGSRKLQKVAESSRRLQEAPKGSKGAAGSSRRLHKDCRKLQEGCNRQPGAARGARGCEEQQGAARGSKGLKHPTQYSGDGRAAAGGRSGPRTSFGSDTKFGLSLPRERNSSFANAYAKVSIAEEFLALPRADAIHLLAQYNGNAETVIQQIFA
ncbi:hypothetical protein Acr_09g0002670 [Actinidia rufa]|uniref:CTLH domain-containing protein n=1 Tax=Actinidia rufa TaxID=165716 RepID=A0A7J0F5B9_9ERIC|nr:hypothetical protein Acr_09g0002670 [Actinidia rufa]